MGDPSSRLGRRLGLADAVVIGLGAMIGAGVFAVTAPAARAAGNGLLLGLVLAAGVAACNALSSAQLAALYPESGGTYVYGRKRLGNLWGFLAGWCFVIGKLASCAAMAVTFATYAAPDHVRLAAPAAALALTAVNYLGVKKTAALTRGIVAIVLAVLVAVIAAIWIGGTADPARLWPIAPTSAYGVLQAAGFLFFAFAGYARLATLGEEVIDPARTIPRAIPIALGITLLVYAAVCASALAALDPAVLASAPAPLVSAVEAAGVAALSPLVRAGAAVACAGVLLSMIAGVSRTTFAMSSNGDLPRVFSAVHPRFGVPHRAELAVGFVVAIASAIADIRSTIAFSAFGTLLYYAVANASAFTLSAAERRWPRALAGAGVAGCLLLAFTLPPAAMAAGAALVAAGAAVYGLRNLP